MIIERRKFIKDSALLTAGVGVASSMPLAMNSCAGANDKLVCGLIGARGMGNENLKAFLDLPNTECAAICDVDENVLNFRLTEVEKKQGKKPKGFKDFRKLLEEPGIDVIIIGTPDHWHCLPFVYAAQEGKHIYCEKPLGRTIEECNIMEAAVDRYQTVAQIGQWQRSDKHWLDAIKYVHSEKLGRIRTVRTWAYLNWVQSLPVVPDSAPPEHLDYDFWLGPAPERNFNKNRYHFNFRWFWDYAGGLMTDWGVHLIDFALYGMNEPSPSSVMSMGGKFAYPDDACETPDTQQTLYDFKDFTLLWDHSIGISDGYYGRDHGVAYVGENGTLVVSRNGWEVIPQKIKGEDVIEKVEFQKGDGKGLQRHMENFIDCIKDPGLEPNANVHIGANIARVCSLGNIAHRTGRRINWDVQTRQIVGDDEASKLLTPSYRAPWELPVV